MSFVWLFGTILNVQWKRVWKKKLGRTRAVFRGMRADRGRWLVRLSIAGLVGVVVLAVLSVVMFAVVSRELPSPDKIVRREGFSTKILDRNGKLIYDIFANQKRTTVDISQIPDYLKKATVAIEDKNFYKHSGFDPIGYLRVVYNLFLKQRLTGGSTLTQQLVKNVLLNSQRSVWRKLKEFILAVQIEKKFTKDQILQMYLNEAPYGGTAWGVESAAETYFGKKVSELNLIESAVLAGLPQRPSYYSPFSGVKDAFKGRTEDVLRRMREDGYISRETEQRALKDLDQVKFATESGQIKAPHFVFYVKKILADRYGEELVQQGGLNVTTTLDLDLQEKSQKAVAEEIAKVETLHITNGAAVVMDPNTGEILSMVGSKNYDDPNYDGKVNVVTSPRQPGSAIKPVTYVTAFKKGYTPATMLMDVATTFPGGENLPEYKPVNYDGKFRGPVQLRYALANSLNIPSVKLLALTGIKDVLDTAYDMGLTTLAPTAANMSRLGLSMTLGGGEVKLLDLVGAYSAFSNGGIRVDPVAILKVTDRQGKVLEEYKPVEGKRVLDEKNAYLIDTILSDSKAREMVFGPRSLLNVSGRTIAVKTGTTNDRRDNWTIGWGYKSRIVGVWVGNNDNSPMKEVSSGVTGAAPIWRRILLASLEGSSDRQFDVPPGMVTLDVDITSGYRAHDGFASRSEYFIAGTEPATDDPIHQKVKVCKSSGKLASPVDIARGDYDEKEYLLLKENDPTGGKDGKNLWQEGIDAWVATQPDGKYHPPTEYCSTSDSVSVEIREPSDSSTVNTNDVKIRIEPITSNGVSKIEIFVDGTSRANFGNSGPYEVTIYMDNGVHTIKATFEDSQGKKTEREIKIGVKVPYNATPTPHPTTVLTATITPLLTPSPTP